MMTRPAQRRANRNQIPGLGEDQPPAETIDAYWTAVDLAAYGWHLRRLDFDAHTATAFVTAHAPTRRVVTVSWDLRGHRLARQQVPSRAAAIRLLNLAHDVAYLGEHDAETGDELLNQLCWLVQRLNTSSGVRTCRHRSWRCSDPLPTLPAHEQPTAQARAAAWLIARLVAKYGWHIGYFAEDIARGGFIAEIPGEIPAGVLTVFPATMSDDGTAAACLARLIPTLQRNDLAVLRNLDYRTLWATRPASGAGQ
jgi:hypothetical protein